MTATVLITRPQAQAKRFAQALENAYGQPLSVVISPLIEITPLPVDGDFKDVQHVIFTSANGVTAAKRLDIPTGITAWCVGHKTAKTAAEAGFDVHIAESDSESLVALIVAQAPVGRMVHIRGRHVAGNIIENLSNAGFSCDVALAYDQSAVTATQNARDLLSGQQPVIVPLFSPRTAQLFAQIGNFKAPLYLVTLGDAIDVSGREIPVKSRFVAEKNAGTSMIEAVLMRYGEFSG